MGETNKMSLVKLLANDIANLALNIKKPFILEQKSLLQGAHHYLFSLHNRPRTLDRHFVRKIEKELAENPFMNPLLEKVETDKMWDISELLLEQVYSLSAKYLFDLSQAEQCWVHYKTMAQPGKTDTKGKSNSLSTSASNPGSTSTPTETSDLDLSSKKAVAMDILSFDSKEQLELMLENRQNKIELKISINKMN